MPHSHKSHPLLATPLIKKGLQLPHAFGLNFLAQPSGEIWQELIAFYKNDSHIKGHWCWGSFCLVAWWERCLENYNGINSVMAMVCDYTAHSYSNGCWWWWVSLCRWLWSLSGITIIMVYHHNYYDYTACSHIEGCWWWGSPCLVAWR